MSQPPGGSLPGSNGNSVQRPSSRGAAVGSLKEERSRAKFEKLQAVYDFPDALKKQHALRDKVLSSSPSRSKKSPERTQAELIKDWLSSERKQADERAERHWKAKFVEWHQELITKQEAAAKERADNLRRGRGMSDPGDLQSPQSESGSWPGLDPNDPDVIAILEQAESYQQKASQLVSNKEQLAIEIVRFREELKAEQQRRASVEKLLQVATEDRDAWSASAQRHELMQKRFALEQHETHAQVAELNTQLTSIRNTLNTEEAKSSANG